MQALALEIGFSETTFVTEAAGDRYSMRTFTPATELPFAGHPSLGTAYVLASEGRIATSVTQSVSAGQFPIEVDLPGGSARMRQLPPKFGPGLIDETGPASALGLDRDELHPDLSPSVVSTGLRQLIVPAREQRSVARAQPDMRRLPELLEAVGAKGLYLFHYGEGSATARMFAPGVGVAEDAATGSAAGPLGAYLAEQGLLPGGRLTISQGMELGRPSTLTVDVQRRDALWEVWVGGGVVIVGQGEFRLRS